MESASKAVASTEVLREVVRQHFGEGLALQASEELREGYFNAAYRLELSDGLKCVLKIAPLAGVRILTYEQNILKTEVEMMELARARTEVPVPRIYSCDTTHRLIGSDYYVMEYLNGTPLHKLRADLSAADSAAVDCEIGQLVRQLNAIEGTVFGYPGQERLRASTWRETFATMLRTVLDDGVAIQAVIPRPYAELYESAARHFAVLDEITVARFVHWDMWDGNIFVDPETRCVTGVIDFERALWGDPLMEANFGGLKEDQAWLDGYGRHMLATPASVQRRHLYNLYLFLIMVVEAYYRDYVEAPITLWARGRLNDTLESLNL